MEKEQTDCPSDHGELTSIVYLNLKEENHQCHGLPEKDLKGLRIIITIDRK